MGFRMSIKSKKGELTTTQLVTIIVLIVSFVIILFLIFRLNLGQTTDAEICHNSVILRGQSKLNSGPLDCKTEYLCISGGEECADFSATEEIDVDVKNEDGIMMVLADKMAECWWMFGEGKVNYGKTEFIETEAEYAMCSTISFDSSIQKQISEISYSDFYDYLEKAKKSQSQTYLQYLYGVSDVESFTRDEQVSIDISQDAILTSEKYSIITGIKNNPTALAKDVVLRVYLVPTAELGSRLVPNREFITKA